VWPLQVDTFIAVGELALFVALADRWKIRSRAAAWLVTLVGLAASVAGNVGHIAGHDTASRFTASVPPLAAAAALAVGLGVLKRVVANKAAPATVTQQRPVTVSATVTPKPVTKRTAKRSSGRTPVTDTEAAIRSALSATPDIATGQLAATVGVSDRTVRRYRARLSAGEVTA
jgi:hypothetical protein